VIGIVDGDIDRLAGCTMMTPGSTIFHVKPGHDDIVGRQVKAGVFEGGVRTRISAADLARKVREIAGERLVDCEEIKPDLCSS